MAIKRVRNRRHRSSTLVANPRRRRKNPRRRTLSAKRNPTRRKRNGTHKGQRRKTARRAYMSGAHKRKNAYMRASAKRNPRRRVARRRNAKGLVFAGIPVVEAAVGSLASLLAINTLSNLGPIKDFVNKPEADGKVPAYKKLIIPALTAGLGVALHQNVKNKMVKDASKYLVIVAIFKAIDDATSQYFETSFAEMFAKKPATGGMYGAYGPVLPGGTVRAQQVPFAGQSQMNGVYLHPEAPAEQPMMGASMFGIH
jgi:hypothetical protein